MLLDLVVHFLRDLHRVAVRLAIDVQQHRRLAVRGDDGVDGLHARRHRGDFADAHGNACWRVLDHDVRDFFRRAHLAADQPEIELVIALQQAGRIDQVGAPDRIQNVGHGHARASAASRDRA